MNIKQIKILFGALSLSLALAKKQNVSSSGQMHETQMITLLDLHDKCNNDNYGIGQDVAVSAQAFLHMFIINIMIMAVKHVTRMITINEHLLVSMVWD